MITVENFLKTPRINKHCILHSFLPVVKSKGRESVLTTKIYDRVPLFKEDELLWQVSVVNRKER